MKKKTLKDLRTERNITQKELAKLMGYDSRGSIAKKEGGIVPLTISDLRFLREQWGVDLNEIEL